MLQNKVKPDVFTYNLLLRCIRDCGLGDVDVAQDVFHRITEESKGQGYGTSKVNKQLNLFLWYCMSWKSHSNLNFTSNMHFTAQTFADCRKWKFCTTVTTFSTGKWNRWGFITGSFPTSWKSPKSLSSSTSLWEYHCTVRSY